MPSLVLPKQKIQNINERTITLRISGDGIYSYILIGKDKPRRLTPRNLKDIRDFLNRFVEEG